MKNIRHRINKGRKYQLGSIFAQSKADSIYMGLRKILDGSAKTLHFSAFGNYPALKAKEISRGIILSIKNGDLQFSYDNQILNLDIKDQFIKDELSCIAYYLANIERIEKAAKNHKEKEKAAKESNSCLTPFSTYRPCCMSFIPQEIRFKKRVFLHIMIKGAPVEKRDKEGSLRYKKGKGRCAYDLNTQHVAQVGTRSDPILSNLAERGDSLKKGVRKEAKYQNAMSRSLRENNPDNFNEDGTLKKGKHQWYHSKNYKWIRKKFKDTCRKNAATRKCANNELANRMIEGCCEVVTEHNNVRSWAKRSKTLTKNKNGRFNRRKRFGRSVRNRCPGGLNSIIQRKIQERGGRFLEVPNNYRASQYDHTADDYIKKTLDQRMFNLKDGTLVQRDWYSAFLLYCYDPVNGTIDKVKCQTEFPKQYRKLKKLVSYLKKERIKVYNTGIKV